MNLIRKITVFSVILSLTFSALFQGTRVMASPAFRVTEAPFVLPEATAGKDYTYQFHAEGGLPPLSWRVAQGDLPQGLRLEASGKVEGVLSPSPREVYQFTVEVTDSSSTPQRFSQDFSLTVRPAPLRIVTSQKPAEPSLRIMMNAATPAQTITPATTPNPRTIVAATGNGVNNGVPQNTAVKPTPTPCPNSQHRVYGRLRPASLDAIVAEILRDPELSQNEDVRTQLRNANFLPEDGGKDAVKRTAILNLLQGLLPKPKHTPTPTPTPTVVGAQTSGQQSSNASPNKPLFSGLNTEKIRKSQVVSEARLRKLIDLLTSYTKNIVVQAENKGGQIVASATTDDDGGYEFCVPPNDADKTKDSDDYYVISSGADNFYTRKTIVVTNDDLKVSLSIEDRPVSLLTRAVVGYQQAGAASTEFEQNYFFDLFVSQSLPFRQKIDPDFGESLRTWGAIRAISAPQSGNVTIGDLSSGFVTQVSGLKANEAARVFDYLGGIEYRLPGSWFNNIALLPSFDRNTKQKSTLSLIVDGGFVTPTNPKQNLPDTYKLSDEFRDRFKREVMKSGSLFTGKELDGKDYVAFVPTDRDRFFRQYYAGIRMQTFFFNRYDVPIQRFPVQLDLQYGINEYVTGGRARGGVLRLDGYFPLPYDNLSFINLFGTAIFRPIRSQIDRTILLEKVDPKIVDGKPVYEKLFDPKTAILPVSQFNRDYYRVGVGIDFVSFVGKLLKAK